MTVFGIWLTNLVEVMQCPRYFKLRPFPCKPRLSQVGPISAGFAEEELLHFPLVGYGGSLMVPLLRQYLLPASLPMRLHVLGAPGVCRAAALEDLQSSANSGAPLMAVVIMSTVRCCGA